MNASLFTANRNTHIKIVVVALIGAITVALITINNSVRTSATNTDVIGVSRTPADVSYQDSSLRCNQCRTLANLSITGSLR